jgi:cell division protein ZapD
VTLFDGMVYEHPLNERIRLLIRIETLFNCMDTLLEEEGKWATQSILATTGDLLAMIQRGDVKSELLKELERHAQTLMRWQAHQEVDQSRIEAYLDQLRHLSEAIHAMSGPFGAEIKRNEFVNSVIQRCSIPGGTCSFDLPLLHHFLSRPFEERREYLLSWLEDLRLLQETASLIMELTRNSVYQRVIEVENGVYNQILEKEHPVQVVQVQLPRHSHLYPEISGNKLQFTVRFMEPGDMVGRPIQTAESVECKLGVCVI